jgi:hypothetical protein
MCLGSSATTRQQVMLRWFACQCWLNDIRVNHVTDESTATPGRSKGG